MLGPIMAPPVLLTLLSYSNRHLFCVCVMVERFIYYKGSSTPATLLPPDSLAAYQELGKPKEI